MNADFALQVKELSAHYGPVKVLHGIDIDVREGELVALVGANGAGKTTLLRVISGVHAASAGRVLLGGDDITNRRSDWRVRAGISQVPEGRQVFGPMTVEDNLRLGGFTRPVAEVEPKASEVYAMFPVLRQKAKLPAGTLSGGQQQMLAIGRALVASPRILLLDEPSMGLAPVLVQDIFATIRRLKEQGNTILLVEQNAQAALKLADRGFVLESGKVALRGTGAELLSNPDVQRAYLGM